MLHTIMNLTGLISVLTMLMAYVRDLWPFMRKFLYRQLTRSYRISNAEWHPIILQDVNEGSVTGKTLHIGESSSQTPSVDYGEYVCRLGGKYAEVVYKNYSYDDKMGFTGDNVVLTVLRFGADVWIKDYEESIRRRADEKKREFLSVVLGQGWDCHTVRRVPRPRASLAYKNGLLDDLRGDLTRFLASEADYRKSGHLYKRVYLFSGEPGTGKSTLALWLASEVNKRVRVIPPAKSGQEILRSVMQYQDHVILLEDVDCLMGPLNRAAQPENPLFKRIQFKHSQPPEGEGEVDTINILLNLMDGPYTPHGMVMILTTNYPERLDEAFRRTGRADRWVKIEAPPLDELKGFYQYLVPHINPDTILTMLQGVPYPLTPSDIENILWGVTDLQDLQRRVSDLECRKRMEASRTEAPDAVQTDDEQEA